MMLALLSFLGGVLTILSPCVLPVLPFVFARSDRPFLRSTLPLLVGMAITFALVATLAAVGGAWAVRVNDYGRILALVVLALLGLALLSKRLAEWLTRPVVALGNRLLSSSSAPGGAPAEGGAGVLQSVLLGVATGFLWAPCAGPILGLILTGAAISGPDSGTTLLLLAYALGAALSMTVAVLAGKRVFAAMKRSFGVGEWLRRGFGVLVLLAVAAIALGWDTGVLTQLSTANTGRIEQALIDAIQPRGSAGNGAAMSGGAMQGGAMMSAQRSSGPPVEGELPALDGATGWLNSPPLTPQSLRGKVVLVDFWTYSCINCLRSLPYVKSWYARYKDQGLVVIGVHAPEFAFEKKTENVQKAIKDLGVTYPVALDNNYAIWQAFNNQYWPAHYFIDASGRIRGHHFGEGNYDESEQLIRTLLTENGAHLTSGPDAIQATGVQAAADEANVQSPETYIGYSRAENFVSPQSVARDQTQVYSLPPSFTLNQWALRGSWQVDAEMAQAQQAGAAIAFRFRARDLHLVLGPAVDGRPVRFRVLIDGAAPGNAHGVDVDASGTGKVTEQRLYQLIRQSGTIGEHTFSIEFLDAGAQAYSFTFG
ncbi:MAG: cytochrome c biogenesis protein CcdA [Steroidobacteraceae bacterium]